MVRSLDIQSLRAQIPATQDCIYMNCGWQGPSPRCVVAAIHKALALENLGPTTAPAVMERRIELLRGGRQAVADLLNATAEEITLQQNTTQGINLVLNGLPLAPSDEVIVCGLEHTSVLVPAYYARHRRGAELKVVSLAGSDSRQDILDKFDAAITARTKLLVISQVLYSLGLRLPVAEIVEMAHQRGAFVLVDGAQAAGAMPVDVRALGCDFYALPGHKWLLGPAGTGALYIRQDLIERLEPYQVSHHAVLSYNFAGHFVPRTLAIDKFELTTVSVPLWAGLGEAIRFIRSIGEGEIAQRVGALAQRLTDGLGQIAGVRLVSPTDSHLGSGLVAFAIDDLAPDEVTAALWEMGRIVGRTVADAKCSRLCLAFFNTEEEVDAVLALVSELAERGLPPQDWPTARIEKVAFWEL